MYSYNFEQQLDKRRQTILLLSQVIPTDTNVLKDIYAEKRKLENQDIDQDYQNFPVFVGGSVSTALEFCISEGVKLIDLLSKEHRMLLRQIRCFQPGFIVYETVDYDEEEEYEYNKFISLKPLTEQTEQIEATTGQFIGSRTIPRAIDVVNRIFDEYEKYNPGKADQYDWRSRITRVEWGYKDYSIPVVDDEPTYFQITGNQHLNMTLDIRQQDFNDTYNENNPWPPNRNLTIIMSEESYDITF